MGVRVGRVEGDTVGLEGKVVGEAEGLQVGSGDGSDVGSTLGSIEGAEVGMMEILGALVGKIGF